MFAVTTTTSISSLSTQTLCYSFSDATKPLSACAAKRKRRSNKSPIGSAEGKALIDEELLISPSQTDAGKDIESGMILGEFLTPSNQPSILIQYQDVFAEIYILYPSLPFDC